MENFIYRKHFSEAMARYLPQSLARNIVALTLAAASVGCVNDDAVPYRYNGPLSGFGDVECSVTGPFSGPDFCRVKSPDGKVITYLFEGAYFGHDPKPYQVSFRDGKRVETFTPDDVKPETWAEVEKGLKGVCSAIAKKKNADLLERMKGVGHAKS